MENLRARCGSILRSLCEDIPNRSVGSHGNRAATAFFEKSLKTLGWKTESAEFNAIDWIDGGASLRAGMVNFRVQPSPFSLGCDVQASLVSADNYESLKTLDFNKKVLLLFGDIAREQLMPKNFVFYNPEEHQRIIARLEQGAPAAIVCATSRNAALAGGVYPFPLIEDGDFNIPSVYMTEEEGTRLLPFTGQTITVNSNSVRVAGKGSNVMGIKGEGRKRIVVTAHIDAKKGTPGAIDNATGVAVLLLLADMLQDYAGAYRLELIAFNGEDYYAVPGQMLYVRSMQEHFNEVLVNINIDGAGYLEGPSAFSFYALPPELENSIKSVISRYDGITEGSPWPQGDHSIFVQNGVPAVAISSAWFTENIDQQEITHTPKDNLRIVDCSKVVEIAAALSEIIRQIE